MTKRKKAQEAKSKLVAEYIARRRYLQGELAPQEALFSEVIESLREIDLAKLYGEKEQKDE